MKEKLYGMKIKVDHYDVAEIKEIARMTSCRSLSTEEDLNDDTCTIVMKYDTYGMYDTAKKHIKRFLRSGEAFTNRVKIEP